MNKNVIAIVLLLAIGFTFSGKSVADDVARECATCDSVSEASLHAQIAGYGRDEGNHTVFVVNLNSTNAWKFGINVVDRDIDGQPTIGDKIVTVLSSQAAPQQVIDGLNDMKAAGLKHLKEDVILTVELEQSQLNGECLSASGGMCANVVNILQSQPDTLIWAAGIGTIGVVWNKLVEVLVGIAGPQLRYIVIYPDGSFEIYYYVAQGSGTGFNVMENTSVSASGAPVSGGTLQGWGSLSTGTTSFTINAFSASGSGGGTTCTEYKVTVSGSGVTQVTSSSC